MGCARRQLPPPCLIGVTKYLARIRYRMHRHASVATIDRLQYIVNSDISSTCVVQQNGAMIEDISFADTDLSVAECI